MEEIERIAALETAVAKIVDILSKLQQDVAIIKSNYVTKADLTAAIAPIASDVALIKETSARKADLAALERRVAIIESTYVTKDDLRRHTLILMAYLTGVNLALYSATLHAFAK